MDTAVTADWVPEVTREAMLRLVAHATKVGLSNTEEFTFRGLFMAAAHDLLDRPRFQTEWERFDLLVQLGEHTTVIEFKYYLLRRTVGLRGELLGYKGGAGLQNEAEFRRCVSKLRDAALPAMRCAGLLARLARHGQPVDRAGSGPVVEIYPAASLQRWAMPHRGYKGAANLAARTDLLDTLTAAAPWLTLGQHEQTCRHSDDALDAVIAAMTAHGAALGLTTPPSPDNIAA